jgi:hypothetical protein
VEQYPQKDHILKASGNNGGGSRQSQHQAGQKTMKRDASIRWIWPANKQHSKTVSPSLIKLCLPPDGGWCRSWIAQPTQIHL